eukprot:4173636-Pyramimonas_sp.AAC.1
MGPSTPPARSHWHRPDSGRCQWERAGGVEGPMDCPTDCNGQRSYNYNVVQSMRLCNTCDGIGVGA